MTTKVQKDLSRDHSGVTKREFKRKLNSGRAHKRLIIRIAKAQDALFEITEYFKGENNA